MNHNQRDVIVRKLEGRHINFANDVPLSRYTTFRLGGRCPLLVFCATPADVVIAIRALAVANTDFLVIGDGSNLLISDTKLSLAVVRYSAEIPEIKRSGNKLTVSGGTALDDLVEYAVNHRLDDFVNCSGIPGTVGGAVAGNAGAFGWQIADCLDSVRLLSRSGDERIAGPKEIGFHYRNSGIVTSREIVLDVTFNIKEGNGRELIRERERILKLRASKHPDLSIEYCAGSFFKNIEPTSSAARRQAAGWFLERSGAKEMVVGGAGVYEKHANIIIRKHSRCTAQDVLSLSRKMATAVAENYGIVLKREVKLVGEFDEFS